MGNCAGGALAAAQMEELARLQRERDELRLAVQTAKEQRQGAEEQSNLLRFKVEVLAQLLAVEEKKRDVARRRLEASKLLALSQGVSAARLSQLLDTSAEGDVVDLAGALIRMQEECGSRLLEIGGTLLLYLCPPYLEQCRALLMRRTGWSPR